MEEARDYPHEASTNLPPIVDRPLYGGLHEFLGSRYRGFCTVLVPVLEHTQGLLALKAIAASQVLGWPKRESNRIRLSTKRSGVPRTPCPQCILPPVPSLANFGSCPSVWILPLVPGPPPTASERGPAAEGGPTAHRSKAVKRPIAQVDITGQRS